MPQYNWKAPDGTNQVIEGDGTSAELIQVRRMWEEQQAKGAKPIGSQPAFMSEVGQRDVLGRAASDTSAQLEAAQSALESRRQEFAGSFSGAGAMAGAIEGGALAGRIAAPAGPVVGAGATAVGAALGGAIGAGAGQYGGAKLMGTSKSEEAQLNDALDAANTNAAIDVGFMGAGALARTTKAEASPYVRSAVDTLFSLKSPDTLAKIARNRELGLRTTVADINPRLAKVYGTIFSVIPAVSNPLRQAGTRRKEEIKGLMDGLTGPLESGLNEVAISKNFLAAATRAYSVRKDWYDKAYGELRGYLSRHPEIEINNDAIGASQKYLYEQAKQARPVNAITPSGAVIESYRTAGFSSPGKIDEFITETMNGPPKLSYPQLEGLTKDISGALKSKSATPDQYTTLVQMRENLDAALEQIPDPTAHELTVKARTRYASVMDFFENPQAKKFEEVSPGVFSSVREITKDKNTPNVVSDKLFSLLMDDLTPEGVRNLKTQVGKTNLRVASDRYVGRAIKANESFDKQGNQLINWRGVRSSLGLDVPGSARGAGTEELLRSSGSPLANGRLADILNAAEKELGPELPPIATMYARQAVFSGPTAAIRGLLATKALPLLGHPALSLGAVLAMRKFSNFLADPQKLNAIEILVNPAIKSPSTKQMAGRQIIRYLATDLAADENPGTPVSSGMIDEVEHRLIQSIDEAAAGQVPSTMPKLREGFGLGVRPTE